MFFLFIGALTLNLALNSATAFKFHLKNFSKSKFLGSYVSPRLGNTNPQNRVAFWIHWAVWAARLWRVI